MLDVEYCRKIQTGKYLSCWEICVMCGDSEYMVIMESKNEPTDTDIGIYLLGMYDVSEYHTYKQRMTDIFGEFTEEMEINYNTDIDIYNEIHALIGDKFMQRLKKEYELLGLW